MKASLTTLDIEKWSNEDIARLKKAVQDDLSAFMKEDKTVEEVFSNGIERIKFLAIIHALPAEEKIEAFLGKLYQAPTPPLIPLWGKILIAVFFIGAVVVGILWKKSGTSKKKEPKAKESKKKKDS